MSVAARVRRPRAPPFLDPPGYARHRPESTLLYRLVEQHYPAFRELRAESGRPLPEYVEQEFEAYLKCGRLEHRFLRVRCEECHAEKLAALTQVLGEVYRTISGFLLQRAGLTRATGVTGAQLQIVVQQIAERVGHVLERRGLVERDMENAWLAGDGQAGPLDDLIGPSIAYRIAVGPRAGQKLFTLQTVPPRLQEPEGDASGAARAGGFSLHAGIGIAPGRRQKLERLCRYVSRPPVATERMAMISSGYLRYALKTPYRDGTTHIVLEPLDLMARLAALVPPPRLHLTRYHGVFAPHSRLRAAVTPARRGMGAAKPPVAHQPPTPRHVAMNWAERLKRVFGIEIDTCQRCGGTLRIIASIEQPEVIAMILAHLERTSPPQPKQPEVPFGARAPPGPVRLL